MNPNKKIVPELMKKTFASRRKTVMDGGVTVQDILTTYPAIKYPDEVSSVWYMHVCTYACQTINVLVIQHFYSH